MKDYVFSLHVVTDGFMTYNKQYTNAVEAIHDYDKFVDYGLAHYLLEVVLVEPNNRIHTKSFDARQEVPIA